MTRRTILTFRKYSDKTEKRLFIRDGVVMNPQVEVDVRAELDDYTAVSLRRTGEKLRVLEHIPSE